MIREISETKKLRLEFDKSDLDGRKRKGSKSFQNLSQDASSEDIYRVGQALADLQTYELLAIKKLEEYTLVE